jgi:hypothetical protein
VYRNKKNSSAVLPGVLEIIMYLNEIKAICCIYIGQFADYLRLLGGGGRGVNFCGFYLTIF